ncbi:MAG: T9SS type A sorting domain-containing protein [Flavobacterium sp. JAD_PAG50586_2]|nr:MAG: T9SS type A sorting domain-containing protein [Flavobacterium sp. JAD_PAG50586_2]
MKQLFTLAALIFSIHCFCQAPNPELFRTWYLYEYYSTDDNIHYPVSAVTPAVSPHVTFTEALDFNGQGACNFFTGSYTSPYNDLVLFENFSATLLLCSSQSQMDMEGAFFSMLQSGGQYTITGQGGNMRLHIETPIFTNFVFGNTALGSPDFDLNRTVIYPNPVTSQLSVDSGNNAIDKVEIINSLGQTVKTASSGFNAIIVSDLASGIYLVKIQAEGKTVLKKVVKE